MSRWPMLLLVLAAAALGLAACGDDGDDGSVSSILSDTFGKGKEVKSGELDLSVKLDAQGLAQLSGPVTAQLRGPFQSSGSGQLPHFDFTAGINAGGQELKVGAVSTGEKGYVSFMDQPYVLSDELFKQFKDGYAEQAKCNADQEKSSNTTFSALGISPRTWLRDARKAGTEKVGGADTTHITGTVDVGKFLEDVNRILARTDPQQQRQSDPCATGDGDQQGEQEPQAGSRQLTAEQRKQIADAIRSAKVDIWTGADDRTMRRMNVALAFDVPEGSRSAVGGMTGGNLAFDLTIGDLNEEQKISGPKDAKPFQELVEAVNNGTGAIPGAGGGSGSGGSGSGGGSKYEQCLNAAGSDVRKLQECQDLVGS